MSDRIRSVIYVNPFSFKHDGAVERKVLSQRPGPRDNIIFFYRAILLDVTEYNQMEEAPGGKRRASQVRDIAGTSQRIPRQVQTAHRMGRRIGSCLPLL